MSEIKKYTYVKVEAENEDEAYQIARNILSNTKAMTLVIMSASVTAVITHIMGVW